MSDKQKRINIRGYLPEKAATSTTIRFFIYLAGLIVLIGYLFYALRQPKLTRQSDKSPSSIVLDSLEFSH